MSGSSDRLQGHCLVWLGTVVWGYGCVLMVLFRAVVNSNWSLAVGQLQNMVL